MKEFNRKPIRRPTLNDVRRFFAGEMTAAEIIWLQHWSDYDADVALWLRMFDPLEDSSEQPKEFLKTVLGLREFLTAAFRDLQQSQIAVVRVQSETIRRLAAQQKVECAIAGFGGATCRFTPMGDGAFQAEFSGLPSYIQPLHFALTSVGLASGAPMAMKPAYFENIVWPDEIIKATSSDELVEDESSDYAFELATNFSTAEERDPTKLLRVDQIGEQTIQFLTHAREGERCRPIRVTLEYMADPSKTTDEIIKHGPLYTVLEPRFDPSELAAMLDIPLPGNAAIGPVTVHARSIVDRELKNLPPKQATAVLGQGATKVVPLDGAASGAKPPTSDPAAKNAVAADAYKVMLDAESIKALENGSVTFVLRFVDTRKPQSSASPPGPELTKDQAAIRDLALAARDEAIRMVQSYRIDYPTAEGILVNATTSAILKCHLLRNKENLKGWFFTILRHEAIAHLRAWKKRGISLDQPNPAADQESSWAKLIADPNGLEPKELMKREDDRRRVQDLIGKLPPQHEDAIILKHFQMLSNDELMIRWGITYGAAAGRVFRAEQALLKLFLEDEQRGL